MKFKVGDRVKLNNRYWTDKKIRTATIISMFEDDEYLVVRFDCAGKNTIMNSFRFDKLNKRGMNPRNAKGQFMPKGQNPVYKSYWSSTLPESITINGYTYTREVKKHE